MAHWLAFAFRNWLLRALTLLPPCCPPVPLQACTNTVMAHWLAIAFSNWLLRVLNQYTQKQANQLPPTQPPPPVMV